MKNLKASPNELKNHGIKVNLDGKIRSALELLSFSNIGFQNLKKIWSDIDNLDKEVKEQIEVEAQYSGYLNRQRSDIEDFKKDETLKIPQAINYNKVGGLSNEVIEKLKVVLPEVGF